MSSNLVIVESPAKAKTIEKYLGKDFTVKSCFGHIRDLPKNGKAIDIENDFTPTYEVTADKKKLVAELKKDVKKADMVWLATDEDREGEAISWHLQEVFGLTEKNTKRIVFHEITKSAILAAIENPRQVKIDIVNAQQARRILDRLVGFELSPVLWRKVKPSLSAGRVQSVAVRIIVERERDISNFKGTSSYRVMAYFESNGKNVAAELESRIPTLEEAEAFMNKCVGASYQVGNLKKVDTKKSPTAPFTTSTLQQEASRKLGFSVVQTMMVAQKLYEAGKITYMRTDSVNLSDTAIKDAKDTITKMYGAEFSKSRQYTSKSKGAQEAHEAIRPTDLKESSFSGERNEERLYDLIWKRTLASQMADAQLERTTVTIDVSTTTEKFIAKGEVIKFEGFLKVYLEGKDDENEDDVKGMLPKMEIGDTLDFLEMFGTQRFQKPPARYTEASLVKKLEELGIGRPSTFAPTISTIQKRGYVIKESREGKERNYHLLSLKDDVVTKKEKTEITGTEKKKMFPTDIGIVVNDFLIEYFTEVLNYNFTADVEEQFDKIAEGKLDWKKMLAKFYTKFHLTVESALENATKATGERELGTDPKTGKLVFAKIGRYGPMIQLGLGDDEDKKFASIRTGKSINDITLDEAMELFKLPRTLGDFEEKTVVAAIGRFGPYVRHDSKFISIKKDEGDPLTITLDEAIGLIKAKRDKDAKALIQDFKDEDNTQILEGRYGPYIKSAKKNYRIPKDKKPEELTYDEVLAIIKAAPVKGKKTVKKKATKKKTTTKKKAPAKKKTVAKTTKKK